MCWPRRWRRRERDGRSRADAATLAGRRATFEKLAATLQVDASAFMRATGWRPSVSPEQGLRDAAQTEKFAQKMKALEDKWGVKAAPVAVAAGPATGGAVAASDAGTSPNTHRTNRVAPSPPSSPPMGTSPSWT